ncbi:hypothetical protein CBR_g39060, partial [Chara braunii]
YHEDGAGAMAPQRAMNMTFQNFVNKTRLTQGMINFCVIVYMDDILVYSETYHGHAQHIEWTVAALRDAGFKLTLEKSEFFLLEISFLRYVMTRGGLRPDSRKVAAVREAPVPTSLTQVLAFLGLVSYYRHFIRGFAAIAQPLTNLLRKDQPLSWDAECEQAFATLKDALAMTPILIQPEPSKQFILITDWQPEAISAIFAQKGNDGREHVIEYASRTVPDEQRNDSAPQGECYPLTVPLLDPGQWRLWREHFVELSVCLVRVRITWARDEDHREWSEYLEWLIIHVWRTNVEGDLLGFLFGSVQPSHRQPIVQELIVPLAQLADDLPLEIVSQSDENPVPHVLTQTLAPYLQWSMCLEDAGNDRNPPSQRDYLSPREIIDPAYFRDRTTTEDEAIAAEEEAAAAAEEEEEEEEEVDEEETPEEGSYSEHSEGEQSEEEEEEEEQDDEEEEQDDEEEVEQGDAEEEEDQVELEESEWEGFEEEVHDKARAQAQAQKREEIAAGKQQLEFPSVAGQPCTDDPARDPEPPKPKDGDPAAETSAALARRRRSLSPSPSTTDRPPVRVRTDGGHRASSPVVIPPSP